MKTFIQHAKVLFMDYFYPSLSAGHKAEQLFERQAAENKWIIEKIAQDKESFEKYRSVATSPVKRGDYICRNCNNAEIEVKCKTSYTNPDGRYFLIEYSHIKRHLEMNKITGSKTVFAFYERLRSNPIPHSLRMVDLDFLIHTHDYQKGKLYNKSTKCIIVPFKYTRDGFKVLEILAANNTSAKD